MQPKSLWCKRLRIPRVTAEWRDSKVRHEFVEPVRGWR